MRNEGGDRSLLITETTKHRAGRLASYSFFISCVCLLFLCSVEKLVVSTVQQLMSFLWWREAHCFSCSLFLWCEEARCFSGIGMLFVYVVQDCPLLLWCRVSCCFSGVRKLVASLVSISLLFIGYKRFFFFSCAWPFAGAGSLWTGLRNLYFFDVSKLVFFLVQNDRVSQWCREDYFLHVRISQFFFWYTEACCFCVVRKLTSRSFCCVRKLILSLGKKSLLFHWWSEAFFLWCRKITCFCGLEKVLFLCEGELKNFFLNWGGAQVFQYASVYAFDSDLICIYLSCFQICIDMY